MTTRYCPECGAEYVATVNQCVDCLVPLLEDVELDQRTREREAQQRQAISGSEQVVYELADWDPDQRVLLERILTSENILHVCEATDLVVRQDDERRVEALMDDLDESGTSLELDPDAEQVVYELSDWEAGLREKLVRLLDESAVPYAWDENQDLVVNAVDEDEVERLLDQVEYPDALPEGDDGGTDAQDVMSTLFVAADRLIHDPDDRDGTIEGVEAARAAEALELPYGFEPRAWATVLERTRALRETLEGDSTDDQVVEVATALRNLLRQYV